MIGVFDSGLGGLTVVKEIFRQLPGMGVLYFGDTARMPYGSKSPSAVTRFAIEDAEFLLAHGAEVIVVACNTASALAVDELRRRARVPIFDVIAPAVRKAAEATRGRIGIIGTRATVASGVYEAKLRAAAPEARTYAAACPLFVPLVEEGWVGRRETAAIAKTYLRPLSSRGIDTLILGCTHYPFLKSVLRREVGKGIAMVDPARETAAALRAYLEAHPDLRAKLEKDGENKFFVSDRTDNFQRLASRWLKKRIVLESTSTTPFPRKRKSTK